MLDGENRILYKLIGGAIELCAVMMQYPTKSRCLYTARWGVGILGRVSRVLHLVVKI